MANSQDRFGFLGREFLTWLWYEGERSGGRVELEAFGHVAVEFSKHLLLKSAGNFDESSLVSAEDPRAVSEARTALQSGKKVDSARLEFKLEDLDFAAKLDTSLVISGAKLPNSLEPNDANHLQDRLKRIEQLEGLIDGLFANFVRLRMDEARWAPVREAMRQWVARGGFDDAQAQS